MALDMKAAVKLYKELDAQRTAIEAEAKNRVVAIDQKMAVIEKWIATKSANDGVDSYKTPYGTVYFAPSAYCSVADWDTVLEFIKREERWDMLTHGVTKKSVTAYLDATQEIPPGITYGTKRTMYVRKPTKKE